MTVLVDDRPDDITEAVLLGLSEWLDDLPHNRTRAPEAVLWSRVTKVCEESGEVWRALSGYVGENPRKGVTRGRQDVEDELLDTANAALAAVYHLHGNDPTTGVLDRLRQRAIRTGIRAGVVT